MEVPDDGSTTLAGGKSGNGASSKAGGSGGSGSPAAGAASCDPSECMTPACADGETLALVTGDCCPTCQPLCTQGCDNCAMGTHPEQHAGECCPTCVKDSSASQAACAAGQADYMAVRDRLAYKYSYGCTADAECTVTAPNNRCEQGCGYTALFYMELDSFQQGTRAEADVDCAMCSAGPVVPCVAPVVPHCFNGQCAFLPP